MQPPSRDTEASRFATKCIASATASESGSGGAAKGAVGRAGARSTGVSEAQRAASSRFSKKDDTSTPCARCERASFVSLVSAPQQAAACEARAWRDCPRPLLAAQRGRRSSVVLWRNKAAEESGAKAKRGRSAVRRRSLEGCTSEGGRASPRGRERRDAEERVRRFPPSPRAEKEEESVRLAEEDAKRKD